MEMVKFIAHNFNYKNRWVKVVLLIVTIALIVSDVVYILRNYYGFGLDNIDFRYAIAQVICHLSMWLIICMWVYAAPKYKEGHDKLRNYLYDITGVVPGIKTEITDRKEEARLLWKLQKACICVRPHRNNSWLINIFKCLYIVLWVGLAFLSCFYLPFIKLHHILGDFLGLRTIRLAFMSMFLCMFSWWGCMEYGFFVSKVSKLVSIRVTRGHTVLLSKKGRIGIIRNSYISSQRPEYPDLPQYYFNSEKPSQTQTLQRMLHDSTMTSVAFLLVSGCYALQYMAAMLLEGFHTTNVWEWMWMLLVLCPGLLSLFPVVGWPKLFILRIHRGWKNQLIRDYEYKLHVNYYETQKSETEIEELRREREYWITRIDSVSRDKLGVKNLEIIISVISVILNFGIMIATANGG